MADRCAHRQKDGSDRAPAASRPSFLLRPKDGSRGRARSGPVDEKSRCLPCSDRLAGSPSDDSGFTCLAFGGSHELRAVRCENHAMEGDMLTFDLRQSCDRCPARTVEGCKEAALAADRGPCDRIIDGGTRSSVRLSPSRLSYRSRLGRVPAGSVPVKDSVATSACPADSVRPWQAMSRPPRPRRASAGVCRPATKDGDVRSGAGGGLAPGGGARPSPPRRRMEDP